MEFLEGLRLNIASILSVTKKPPTTLNKANPRDIEPINKRGKLKKIVEKPKSEFFVNTGLYVFKPKILNLIPKNEFFHMTQLIERVKMKKYTVGVYPIRDTDWIDIGQITNYKDLAKRD